MFGSEGGGTWSNGSAGGGGGSFSSAADTLQRGAQGEAAASFTFPAGSATGEPAFHSPALISNSNLSAASGPFSFNRGCGATPTTGAASTGGRDALGRQTFRHGFGGGDTFSGSCSGTFFGRGTFSNSRGSGTFVDCATFCGKDSDASKEMTFESAFAMDGDSAGTGKRPMRFALPSPPPSIHSSEGYVEAKESDIPPGWQPPHSVPSGCSEEELSRREACGTLLHCMARRSALEDVFPEALPFFPEAVFGMTDDHGQNVLHTVAAFGRSVTHLDALMERMPSSALSGTSSSGHIPLFFAIHYSNKDIALALLQKTPKEALAARNENGANLLHALASCEEAVAPRQWQDAFELKPWLDALPAECLVQQDAQGRTPLHRACAVAMGATVLELLEATPRHVLSLCDNDGWCPLELALTRPSLMPVFSSRKDTAMERLIELSKEHGVIERKQWKLVTPLHAALALLNPELVHRISAMPQAKEWALIPCPETGLLPLHFFVSTVTVMGGMDLGVIEKCITPGCLTAPILSTGETVLHVALAHSSYSAAEIIDAFEEHCDVDAVDNEGRTAFVSGFMTRHHDHAVLSRVLALSKTDCPLSLKQWRVVEGKVDIYLLLEVCERYAGDYLANTTADDWKGGWTPLHSACYPLQEDALAIIGDDKELFRGRMQRLLSLLPAWFIGVKDKRGYTPIHEAVANKNFVALQLLMDIPGAEEAAMEVVTGTRHPGRPLEVAVKLRQTEIVKLLLTRSPDLKTMPTSDGRTLMELVDSVRAFAFDSQFAAEMADLLAVPVKSAAL